MTSPRHELVLILDFGSQYTQLIARRIREAGIYCEIHPFSIGLDRIRAMKPTALVLSGGPSSVYAEGAPRVEPGLFDLGIPTLGICYGMQLMAHMLGGRVERATAGEYGPADVRLEETTGIFVGFQKGDVIRVWMSHGDRTEALPPGFRVVGSSENAPFCAVANEERKLYGLQFHPEVTHTPRGFEILRSFLFDVAKISPSWTASSFSDEAIAKVRAQVGPNEQAICGLSGGVDSSVAALICHRALGDRLTCVFVDTGMLRQGEAEEVVRIFRDAFQMKLVHVDARERFLSALSGAIDPEKKRKIIGRVFIDVFDEEAAKIMGAKWLVQGTVYPDVIESIATNGPSSVIKSHHNVGGLPEHMKLGLIEPLRELFKDEVRKVGETLGLPHHLVWRQPFPGPGLAVRCLGPVEESRLALLRRADAIVEEETRQAGVYESLWQAFAVLLPVRAVGVMGDERTYGETVAIRAVTSTDGMTADFARLPLELLARMSSRIMNEVRGISRVVYDISPKPPATIEWE